MPIGLDFQLTGTEELQRKLSGLSRSAAGRIWRKGLTKGLKPMVAAARARVPKRTGLLRKSLAQKVKIYRNGGKAVGLVGPRRGFTATHEGRQIRASRYAHLVERTQPFLGPAARQTMPQVVEILAQVGNEEVLKLVR